MTIRLVTNTLLLFAFASGLPAAARPQEGPPRPKLDSRIVAAKTAFLTTEILYPKTEKSSFTSELNTILAIASGTKVWTVYKPATATKAETIMKIVEDRRLGMSID